MFNGHLPLILWKICTNSNCQSLSLNLDAGPENFLLYYAYLSCIFRYKFSRVLSLLCFCSVLLWRVEPLAFTTAELSSCKIGRSYSLGFSFYVKSLFMNCSKIHWLRLSKYPTHPYLQDVFDGLHEELKDVVHGGSLRVHELHPVLILSLGPLSTCL